MLLLANEQSERDTFRGVQLEIVVYKYVCHLKRECHYVYHLKHGSRLNQNDATTHYCNTYAHSFIAKLLTLSAHAREGYSSHFVCLSVCVSLLHSGEGADFRVEIYISIRFKSFKSSTFLKIEAILEKKRVELRP